MQSDVKPLKPGTILQKGMKEECDMCAVAYEGSSSCYKHAVAKKPKKTKGFYAPNFNLKMLSSVPPRSESLRGLQIQSSLSITVSSALHLLDASPLQDVTAEDPVQV